MPRKNPGPPCQVCGKKPTISDGKDTAMWKTQGHWIGVREKLIRFIPSGAGPVESNNQEMFYGMISTDF